LPGRRLASRSRDRAHLLGAPAPTGAGASEGPGPPQWTGPL